MLKTGQRGNQTGAIPVASLQAALLHAGKPPVQAESKLARMQSAYGNQRMLRVFSGGVLHRKLTINKPGDVYEREADRVADEVMRMPDPTANLQPITQTGPAAGMQRCSCGASPNGSGHCEECKAKTMTLHRVWAGASEETTAPPIVHDVLRSPGRPLDAATRSFMEPRFGHDFSGVRVHTDGKAVESARAVNALAYTVGQDIAFNEGQYGAESAKGRRLLAHELAHAVQQSGPQPLTPIVQRAIQEAPFPGGGKVDDVRAGEHLLWNFEIGQHTLRSGHKAQIPKIAAEIKKGLALEAGAKVDIEGQASLTGTQQRNQDLSQRRANAVKDALIKEGVAADRINLVAVGSMKSTPGSTQEDLARSRRVRIILPVRLVRPAGGGTPPPQTGACQGKLSGDLTLTGATVGRNSKFPFLRIQAGDGTGNSPGMLISGIGIVTPPKCGDFLFLQNVQAFRQIIYKDRTRNTFQISDFVLDTSDPYPSQDFGDPNTGVVAPTANDSPSESILATDDIFEAIIKTMEIRDDFRMFLLFQPTGQARTVVQVAEWSWVAQLTSDKPNSVKEGTLVLDGGISRVSPQSGKGKPSAITPVVSPNITSVNWVTDNGGVKPEDSLATLDRTILDKTKPKADAK